MEQLFRVNLSGNVGIGTTSPATKLNVVLDSAGVSDVDQVLALDRTTSGTPAAGLGGGLYFRIENSAGAVTGVAQVAGIVTNVTSGAEDGALAFYTRLDGGSVTERMRIIDSGNVGIGTTGPGTQLHLLKSDGTSAIAQIEASSGGSAYLSIVDTATETWQVGQISDGSGRFDFKDDTGTRVSFTNAGNVGIGITGPQAKMDINVGNGFSTLGSNIGLRLTGAGGAVNELVQIGFGYSGTVNPAGVIGAITTNDAGVTNVGLIFATRTVTTDTAPTERMRITSGGNVGIGTTNPSAGVLTVLPTAESISDVITIPDYNVGNGNAGPIIRVGRNNNGTATGAGSVNFVQKDATDGYVWQDDAGNMRINTLAPTNGNDTAGTVIGTQTSWIELKTNISSWSGEGALQTVLDTPLYNFEFINDGFKTAQNGKPSYSGLVIGESDRAQNAWYARNLGTNQTPVLNEPNLFGYLTASVQEIGRRISLTAAPTSTPTLTINSGGLVGIASTSPWRTLSVTGTVGFSSSLTAESGSDNYLCIDPATYEVTDGGANCGASSLRYKKDIAALDYGLDAVLKLNPVSFYWNEAAGRPDDLTRHLGFIAEEVYGVIPEVVALNASSTPESIEYDKLTAILTKAIQELNAKIEAGIAILKDLIVDTLTAEMVITNKIRAEDIETQRLKVESGVTVKDRGTGEPYCMFIEYGAVRSAPGPCSTTSAASSGSATPSGSEEPATPQDQQTVDTPTTSEPDEDAPPESTPEPSESPTPDPEPSASPAPSPTEPSEQPTDP
ncbi:MAG: tail fiber domain-containing protein [Patescibacteria group bacterium]|nr:tail fiber domain-containing protein [Patescibacteria group bacterium]